MSKHTKNLMRRVERRLDRYIDLETTHCGHEGPMAEAHYERERFLAWLAAEIEAIDGRAAVAALASVAQPGDVT